MPVFVIRNQQGQFLNKQKEWQDSGDSRSLTRLKHHDEALNVVFELSSKDIYLRAVAVECEQDSSGNPVIVAQEMEDFPYATATEMPVTENDADEEHSLVEADSTDTALPEENASPLENAPSDSLDEFILLDESSVAATANTPDHLASDTAAINEAMDEEAELAAALAEEQAEIALTKEEAL